MTSEARHNTIRPLFVRALGSDAAARLWAVLLALSLGGVVLADQLALGHGLRRQLDVPPELGKSDAPLNQVFTDANDFSPDEPSNTTLSGALWMPRGGTYRFALRTDGGAALELAGQTVVEDRDKHPVREAAGEVTSEGGALSIRVTYHHAPGASERALLDLWWQPPGGGWARVPRWALFQAGPSPDELARAAGLRAGWLAARLGIGLALAGLALNLGLRAARGTADWRVVLGLLAVAGLAVSLRVIFVQQRAANDPGFYTLPVGTDMRVYEAQARGLARGTWPGGESYYFQPGVAYFLYFLHLLVGPDLLAARLAEAVLGGLLPVLAFFTGKLAFDARAGWVAAVLAALFPPIIFYVATGLVTALAVLLAGLLVFSLLRLAERPTWGNAALAGVVLGMLVVAHQSMMAFAPVVVAWLVLAGPVSRGRALALSAVLLLAAALMIAPFTLQNYRAGGDYLLTPTGQMQFYNGNNRDATGFYGASQAWHAARLSGKGYLQAFRDDVRAEPFHMLQLMGRKLAMFWDSDEVLSNLSYAGSGTRASPLLRALNPFNMTVLSLLALTGGTLVVTGGNQRRGWLLVAFVLTVMGALVAFTPEARLRAPVVAGLFPLAGFAVVAVYDALRPSPDRARLLAIGKAAAGVGLVLLLLGVANDTLPLPRLHPAGRLPAEATPLELQFEDKIRLVGYRISQGADGVAPEDPLLIVLYWQRVGRMDRDYNVFLHLIGRDGGRWSLNDVSIGLVSFQPYLTSRWRDDRIFQEEYMLVVDGSTPVPLAADVWVGVYDRETDERLHIIGQDEADATTARVTQVRLEPAHFEPPSPPAFSVDADFGGWARLGGYDLEQRAEALALNLHWQVTATPPQDYNTFVHLLDREGELLAQHDGPQLDGLFPTSVWRAGDSLLDTLVVPLGPDLPPGDYSLTLGLYDVASGTRVPITDASGDPLPDAALPLSSVTIP